MKVYFSDNNFELLILISSSFNFLTVIFLTIPILKIAKLGHPVLLKKTNEISNLNDINLKQIIYDMSETMIDANGIGLAAPQVHLSHRLFIYRNPDIEEEEKIKVSVLINPQIEKISDETDDDWEGCLSIPGMSGLVRRSKKIKYSGIDLKGERVFGEPQLINTII